MMKVPFLATILIFASAFAFARQDSTLRLMVSADGHFLQYANGRAFFWLGDTGWEMLARLNKEEIEQYLENRRQKGFNVIQTVALDDSSDPIGPNRYGERPLINNDPDRPNEKYFAFVDWTIQLALKKGLYIALLPTWAGNVVKKWGTPQAMFNEKNAYHYGLFLGKRYKRLYKHHLGSGRRPAGLQQHSRLASSLAGHDQRHQRGHFRKGLNHLSSCRRILFSSILERRKHTRFQHDTIRTQNP